MVRLKRDQVAWLDSQAQLGESRMDVMARIRREQELMERRAVKVVSQPIEGGSGEAGGSGVPWGWILAGTLLFLAVRAGTTLQQASDGSFYVA